MQISSDGTPCRSSLARYIVAFGKHVDTTVRQTRSSVSSELPPAWAMTKTRLTRNDEKQKKRWYCPHDLPPSLQYPNRNNMGNENVSIWIEYASNRRSINFDLNTRRKPSHHVSSNRSKTEIRMISH